ncbi:MarR family winged helix-turn-helix transcriptional regulator [Faecalimicrobium sp. JNUCC 81]
MKNIQHREYVFGSIFALANRLQVLGDKMDEKITVKQWFFIATVSMINSNPSISEISKLIGTSRQNVKKMALLLENQGFLIIQEDKSDKRISRISLTQKCFEYFQDRQSMEEEFMESLFYGFSQKNIEDLSNGIALLINNLEKMEIKNEDKE